jgi:hypothetical protein
MDEPLLTDCQPDGRDSSPFAAAMDDYDEPAEKGRWPWNVLARDAVVYSCGAIALPGVGLLHRHSPSELALCRRLYAEAASLTSPEPFDHEVWLSLVRTSSTSSFLWPFYMAASVGAPVVTAITAEEIRRAFGGTIYPPAEVRVEPLREGEPWWQDVANHYTKADEQQQALDRWRMLLAWFGSQQELSEPSSY